VHYVGNPGSTASGNRSYFESGSGGLHTSAHYIIGLQGEALRLMPDDEPAMHAGKAYGDQYKEQAKKNNSTMIGIECCHPDATGKFSANTRSSLVQLCAELCLRHGFDPDKAVYRHYDVCGKECPVWYVRNPKDWEALKADIAAAVKCKPPSAPSAPAAAGDQTSASTANQWMSLQDEGVVPSFVFLRGALKFKHLASLLENASKSGFIDRRIRNGVPDIGSAVGILSDSGIISSAGYWLEADDMQVRRLLVNLADSSRALLEKMIQAEAGGEGEDGQLMVGNVILNRVAADGFPNTVHGVVFQEGQFQPARDGAYAKAKPSESVKRALDRLLKGEDLSQGALYFRAAAGATPDCWHEKSLELIFEHKGHRFYR
jgi:hypothetical protein